MRGALPTLSRPNAAWLTVAFLAFGFVHATNAIAEPLEGPGPGPSLPSAAPLSASSGDNDAYGSSFAYAVPRNAPSADVEVILPQPLPPGAVAQVQRILTLQDNGDYAAADRLIGRLDDTTLLGPILADRYLSPNYRSSSNELLDWYEQYNDQPEASAIYQLLLKKLPRHVVPPLAPVIALLPEPTVTEDGAARPSNTPDNPSWRNLFMTGINDWKRGDIDSAGPIFMRAAEMAGISSDDRAAADFWAARAALRLQQPDAYLDWLHLAANAPGSFYGILAGRLLGQGFGPTGIAATLTEADITAVDATPDGHLAFALLQVGETDQAATALRALWPDMQNDPDLGRAVMAVAARAGLVDVAIAVGAQVADPDNEIAGARLPMPALHPAGGFTIDPALVYALARTESGFDPDAVSPAGARGLMQLMPRTARYIRRSQGISGTLGDPSANLALGQAYIRYLGDQNGISDNLLAILASYNAGPGAAAVWCDALAEDSDPLVFIETITNTQTRHFVHQVLADSWIYAEEIGIRPASLDDLADGNFPTLSLSFAAASAN
jgi:soluble lytic murein transglycosylase-like protein